MDRIGLATAQEDLMEQLQDQLNRWTAILGLSHWDIVLKVKDRKDPDMLDAQGRVNYELSSQTAVIKILDPGDWDNADFLQDAEKTLVHELLHLHIGMCCEPEPGTMEHIVMEQTVQTLARAFIRVDREKVQ